MTTWDIDIEADAGAGEDALERFAVALARDKRALGSACSVNTETGVLGASFTVEAASEPKAHDIAIDAIGEALAEAGITREDGVPVTKLAVELDRDAERAVA